MTTLSCGLFPAALFSRPLEIVDAPPRSNVALFSFDGIHSLVGGYDPCDLAGIRSGKQFSLENGAAFVHVAPLDRGACAVTLEGDSAIDRAMMDSQPVTPGRSIRIGFVARASATAPSLRVRVTFARNTPGVGDGTAAYGWTLSSGLPHDGSNSNGSAGVWSDPATFPEVEGADTGWRRYEITFTPGADVTMARIGVGVGAGTGLRRLDVRTFAWTAAVPPLALGSITAPTFATTGDAILVALVPPADAPLGAIGPTPIFRGLPSPAIDVRVLRDGVDIGGLGALTPSGSNFTTSYAPVAADIGRTITFRAVATNASGTAQMDSAAMRVAASAAIDAVRYVDPAPADPLANSAPAPRTTTVAAALTAAKATPYRTIAAACAGAVPAGTLIVVKSGTEAAPITYREQVVFTGVIATTDGTLTGAPKPVFLVPEVARGVRIEGPTGAGTDGQAIRLLRSCHIEIHNFVVEGRGSGGLDYNPIQITVGDDTVQTDGGIYRGQTVVAGCRIEGRGTDMLKAGTALGVQVLGNEFIIDTTVAGAPTGQGIDFVTVFDSRVAFNTFRDKAGLTGPSCNGAFYNKAGGARVVWERNDVDVTPADEVVMCGGGGTSRAGSGGAPRNLPFGRVGFGYAWAESYQDIVRDNRIVSRNAAAPPLRLKGAVEAVVDGNWFMVTDGDGGAVSGAVASVVYSQSVNGFWADQGEAIMPADALAASAPLYDTAAKRAAVYRANIEADATARGVTPPGNRVVLRGSTLNRDGVGNANVSMGSRDCVVSNNIRVGAASFVTQGTELSLSVRTTDADGQAAMVNSLASPQWDGAASQTGSGNTVSGDVSPPAEFPSVGHAEWSRAAIYARLGIV